MCVCGLQERQKDLPSVHTPSPSPLDPPPPIASPHPLCPLPTQFHCPPHTVPLAYFPSCLSHWLSCSARKRESQWCKWECAVEHAAENCFMAALQQLALVERCSSSAKARWGIQLSIFLGQVWQVICTNWEHTLEEHTSEWNNCGGDELRIQDGQTGVERTPQKFKTWNLLTQPQREREKMQKRVTVAGHWRKIQQAITLYAYYVEHEEEKEQENCACCLGSRIQCILFNFSTELTRKHRIFSGQSEAIEKPSSPDCTEITLCMYNQMHVDPMLMVRWIWGGWIQGQCILCQSNVWMGLLHTPHNKDLTSLKYSLVES